MAEVLGTRCAPVCFAVVLCSCVRCWVPGSARQVPGVADVFYNAEAARAKDPEDMTRSLSRKHRTQQRLCLEA